MRLEVEGTCSICETSPRFPPSASLPFTLPTSTLSTSRYHFFHNFTHFTTDPAFIPATLTPLTPTHSHSQVGEYVDSLRRGKSRVVEAGHTLIIGQGDKLLPTIIQICMANQSEGGGLIVVLTRLPKTELEDTIADAQIDTLGSDVVIRTGSPFLPGDLLKVSAAAARSIIVLADRAEQAPDESDVMVVRTVLSLRAMGAPVTGGHITAEVCDLDNEELVHLVGDGRVETIVCHDVVGRLMIQCAQRKGLAQVMIEKSSVVQRSLA